MKQAQIEIRRNDYTSVKVKAYKVSDTIAVHKRLTNAPTREYSITHIPSGARFDSLLAGRRLNRKIALKLGAYFSRILGRIDKKDHRDAAKAMIKKCPTLREKTLRKYAELKRA